MPTYEYKCTKCGHIFDVFQKMSDARIEKCPKCDGPVERLISGGTGLIFKGSGFYITDYKKTAGKKETDKDSPKKDSKEKTESTAKKPSETPPSNTKSSD